MTDTNLITQAITAGLETDLSAARTSLTSLEQNFVVVVNGLQSDLLTFESNLLSVLNANNNSLNSALSTAVNDLNTSVTTQLATLSSQLATHIAQDYSVAHTGITSSQATYLDSADNTVGNYVVNFQIGGVTYYVPASLNSAGVYVPPPPPPPPPPSPPPSPPSSCKIHGL